MKKFNFVCRLAMFIAFSPGLLNAQSTVLVNADVLKLFDSGVGDRVIVAKIRQSQTNFETSSEELLKFKAHGLSDEVILAMIEAKPNRSLIEDVEPKREFVLKDAVGSKNIYIDCVDKASEIELTRELKGAGFTIVTDKRTADLVVNFAVYKSTSPRSVGDVGNKWGRMTISLRKDGGIGVIFVQQKDPAYWNSKNLYNQARRLIGIFLKQLASASAIKST
ncbi:MAG: hypothetical protein HOP17_10915 [Acidobacteria bacterium]|nr:hypothetical protein [Acidobacteriota bacterium]